jgi:hypothetical protein
MTSGGVECWGYPYFGELGNGQDTTSNLVPGPVFGVGDEGTLLNVKAINGSNVTDRDSYCGVLTDKKADCWGLGVDGELGSGSAGLSTCQYSDPCATTPVPLVGTSGTGSLKKIKSILGNPTQGPRYAGSYCALLTTGKVDCWGYAPEGELGNGTYASSFVPGPVFTG